MTQQQDPQAILAQRNQALRTALEQVKAKMKPFAGWGTIWQLHCIQTLHAVEAYPHLALEVGRYKRAITAEVEETCIRLAAYGEQSDSMGEESLRKRRRIHHSVQEQLIPSVEKLLPAVAAQEETVTVSQDTEGVDAEAEAKILQIGPGKEAPHD